MRTPGSDFWPRVEARTRHAAETGALKRMATRHHVIPDRGIDFLVRVPIAAGVKKDIENEHRRRALAEGREYNPFLPYEEDLFVGDLTETHFCLLNKYNVIDHHILIVTRTFTAQEAPLDRADMEAARVVLAETDGLLFYNAGRDAGASQRHKHLQFLPLHRSQAGVRMPIEALLPESAAGQVPGLGFSHFFARLAPASPWVDETLAAYDRGLETMALRRGAATAPYNLLVTRDWLLLVPRCREKFGRIQVNSLGFAGFLLARDQESLARIRSEGPMAVLSAVACEAAVP